MKAPLRYDDRHPFAVHVGPKTTWLGDPARGEFTPKDKKKKGKRKPR